MLNRTLSSPGWTLQEKVRLTAQVLGMDQEESALKGNALDRLIDSTIQRAFRRMSPLGARGSTEERWAGLLAGYLRLGRLSRRLGYTPFVGDRLVRWVSKRVGQMIIRNRFWTISPESSTDLLGLTNEYLKFAEGIGLEIDFAESYAGRYESVIVVSKCSAGVELGYPKSTCRAMNEMDREVVRLLGGRLQTPQTIADNGQCCCFKITQQIRPVDDKYPSRPL